jgi:hypothetical protein
VRPGKQPIPEYIRACQRRPKKHRRKTGADADQCGAGKNPPPLLSDIEVFLDFRTAGLLVAFGRRGLFVTRTAFHLTGTI